MEKLKEYIPGLSMIVLALTGMLLDVQNAVDLPIWADTILTSLETLVLFMGIRDLIDEKKAVFLKRLIDFKSKTFWGVLASSNLTTFLFNAEMIPGLGLELAETFSQVGALVAGWGLVEAGKRGKNLN